MVIESMVEEFEILENLGEWVAGRKNVVFNIQLIYDWKSINWHK
jgi:hypothetical protein